MKSFSHVLIISAESECAKVVLETSRGKLSDSHILHVANLAEGINALNEMEIINNRIPACIFLSTDFDLRKMRDFLDLLDNDFSYALRHRVVLLNAGAPLHEIMKLATSSSVGQFINCPVLPIEVESVLKWDEVTASKIG